jgi:hypothetical protein
MIRNTYKKILQFDDVTRFRLINAFIIAIGMNLLFPVIADLKGEYLVAWVISLFMIMETLAVKTNRYFVEKFTISQVYKMSVIAHLNFTLIALLYFVNPLWMVLGDMIAAIVDVTIFSAYSIMLTNHMTDNYPESMKEFQIIRNSTWADGILIGLTIVTILTFFWGNAIAVGTFIIFNTIFSMWLIKNWNFFQKRGL